MNHTNTTVIITACLSFISAFLIVRFFLIFRKSRMLKSAKKQSADILKEAKLIAEKIKKDKIIEAKERIVELKSHHEKSVLAKNKEIAYLEKKFKSKEYILSKEIEKKTKLNKSFEEKEAECLRQKDLFLEKKEKLKELYKEKIQLLESISGLSAHESKIELLKSLKEEVKTDAMAYIRDRLEEAKLVADQDARKIVLSTIQRIGVEQTIENCVSVFNIESDELKGRIIGREGRNVRAFEAATGVEIIIDDTPESIVLSCFDPVRREIARLSLDKLVTDGRIHPGRIEEIVEKTRKQIDQEIIEVGKKTIIDLGIHGLHPELIKIVGRMKFRSSYGQNLLQHSREVSNLSALMAAELGLDVKMAKRAGLLHDIGKVPTTENELPHALLAMEWAKKYGENPEVCNAIGAHHDEISMKYMISPVIQVCDAISGARPGARSQQSDSYIRRLQDLESLAFDFDGVQKAYAIQAGRELRVLVESDKVSDEQANDLSFKISRKIKEEMTYPGQVKVIVIRETRSTSIAR